MNEWLPSICTATLDELKERGAAAMKEYGELLAEVREIARQRHARPAPAQPMRFMRIGAKA